MAAFVSSDIAAGTPIGPGKAVLVVGPSGAGKDALLARARTALAGERHIHFPERLISRPAHAAEAHASLPLEAFATMRQSGAFALAWEAHGLSYALPRSIDDIVASGGTVVFNASRAIVPHARQRYASLTVLLVDAPMDVRARRLVARGRETLDEVERRLARRSDDFEAGSADVVVDNSGDIDDAAQRLIAAIIGVGGP